MRARFLPSNPVCLCVGVYVCVGDLLVNCAVGSWGGLGGAFGACLPQCGEEFSQSSHQKCAGFMGHSGH